MNTRKIVINSAHGGFGLTDKAIRLFLTKKKISFIESSRQNSLFSREFTFFVNGKYFSEYDIKRDDPVLIEVLEELGLEQCEDSFCSLKIVEIPIDVEWQICEYDGSEWVAEKHRTWE